MLTEISLIPRIDSYQYMMSGNMNYRLQREFRHTPLQPSYLTIHDVLADTQMNPLEHAEAVSHLSYLAGILEQLEPLHAYLIIRRFGLGDGIPNTMASIGKTLGRSPSWIYFRLQDALQNLKDLSKGNFKLTELGFQVTSK